MHTLLCWVAWDAIPLPSFNLPVCISSTASQLLFFDYVGLLLLLLLLADHFLVVHQQVQRQSQLLQQL